MTWACKTFLHASTNAYALTNKTLKPLHTPFITIYSNTILSREDGRNKKTSKEC